MRSEPVPPVAPDAVGRVHRPDLSGARQWLRAMRRIDRVIFRVSNDGCTACIDAVFHRTPVRREVTVGAALGLMELRVPATVERR